MATTFKNAVVTNIGTTPSDVLQMPLGFRCTVIGLNLANRTEFDSVVVNVYIVDEDSVAGYYIRDAIIPPNSALKLITNGEKLIIPSTGGIRVVSDTADSVDAVISYVEIT